MLHTLWITLLYQPIYNLLLVFISIVPGGDVGIALIIVTLIVKALLFPLTQRSIESQLKMRALEPQIAKLKEETTDKVEQNKRTYELYKKNKINPFSGCLLILIQLPIIIALYIVLRDFNTTSVLPYSFVQHPEVFNVKFLGLVDLTGKSILFAVLAGLTQFIQGKLMQGRQSKPQGQGMQAQLAKTMQIQMVYFIPLITAYVAYQFSAAVALYLITSNIVTILQELYTARRMKKGQAAIVVA